MGKKEELVDAVLKAADGDRKTLTCAEAFTIAQDHEAGLTEIGRICNDNEVKICSCQLGCFK